MASGGVVEKSKVIGNTLVSGPILIDCLLISMPINNILVVY